LRTPCRAKRQGKTMNEIKSAFETSIKKAVIDARFSTDLQNERSIEDQITTLSGLRTPGHKHN
jgi:hypothetical protein